jgi:hypothetical protein
MKAIIIEEKDIHRLIDSLKLEKFENMNINSTNIEEIKRQVHRRFHYIVVNWAKEEGSSYPHS